VMYPYMFPETRFQDAFTQVAKILRLVRVRRKGRTALDLACGPGRCAIALAERGFAVTGVYKSKYLLAKARARARKERARIEWVRADMRDFIRPGAYDVVINMFTSFGYFDDKTHDLHVLRNIHASLRPGGALVMDVVGKEILMRMFQATTSTVEPDGSLLVQRHELFDEASRIRNEWILIKGGRARTFRFHHTLYSGQELKSLLRQAGFAAVRLCGSLDGEEYSPAGRRLIAVAVKA
jgi:SAM-dependent methyltransferase